MPNARVAASRPGSSSKQLARIRCNGLHCEEVSGLLLRDGEDGKAVRNQLVAPSRIAVDVFFPFVVRRAVVLDRDAVLSPQEVACACLGSAKYVCRGIGGFRAACAHWHDQFGVELGRGEPETADGAVRAQEECDFRFHGRARVVQYKPRSAEGLLDPGCPVARLEELPELRFRGGGAAWHERAVVSKVECVHAAELESDEREIVQRYVARKLKEAELG